MEISLSSVDIGKHPRYHCLSYVWGNPASVYPIVVDGVEVLVNQNLGEALARIEGEDGVEFLWADALCINQNSVVEKMHQVQMMDRIYEEAAVVLAWLGPEADSSGEVLDEVSRVGGIIIRNLINTPYPSNMKDELGAAIMLSIHKATMLILQWIDVLMDPNDTGRGRVPDCWADIGWEHSEHRLSIEAWTAFFSRPYWRRVWIIQELATACNADLLCGSRRVSLGYLCALRRFATAAIALVTLPEAVRRWISSFHQSTTQAPILGWLDDVIDKPSNTKSDLLDLLKRSGSMDATVPQDRIFALSALTVNDQKIDLDYSKTLQEHLADVTRKNYLRLGFHVNATPDFRAGGQAPWILSQQNFPRPDILRLPCQVLGRVINYGDLRPTEKDLERHRIIHDRASMPTDSLADGSTPNTSGVRHWLKALSALRKLVSFLAGPDDRKLSDLDFADGGDQLVRQICSLILCPGVEVRDALQEFIHERDTAFYLGLGVLCCSEFLFDRADEIEDWTGFRSVFERFAYTTSCIQNVCHNRFVFETSDNYIGLGPDNLELGDYIVILPGTSTPHLARPAEAGAFELMGQIYIPGVMYGERFDIKQNDDWQIWMEFC
ncbi:heterokaryon incompatibility protein [Rutstroemia sp. NJR-2017a BBW]|nr:heterokaryon incompatibility protein [Rutstroemia sp. NJR-2017a BBW]